MGSPSPPSHPPGARAPRALRPALRAALQAALRAPWAAGSGAWGCGWGPPWGGHAAPIGGAGEHQKIEGGSMGFY